MAGKEAKATIKINKLLEESGWRFFDTSKGKAAIKLEASITMDDWGVNFEHAKNDFSGFLPFDEKLITLLHQDACCT